MSRSERRGFTLVEAVVGLAIFITVLAAVIFTFTGARREEKMAALQLTVMENAAMAIHQVRTDLRQAVFVPGQPVNTHSFKTSADGTVLLLRRSVQAEGLADYSGSLFILVEYRMIPTGIEPGTFFLQRTEQSMGGNIPGKNGPRDVHVFRNFMVASANFYYLGMEEMKSQRDPVSRATEMLFVGLDVISDSGEEGQVQAFQRKHQAVTSFILITPPELPFDMKDGQPFAHLFPPPPFLPRVLPPNLEPVLAPEAIHATELPDPGTAL